MTLADQEASVNQELSLAVIHNRNSHNAHHDIILPAIKNDKSMNIAVSCKASFNLSNEKTLESQLKTDDESVGLLVCLYLGNHQREAQYQNVVFLNGSGCCNGLMLNMFVLTRRLISQNKQD